jgi:hypothetical protein
MFCGSNGKAIDPDNFARRVWELRRIWFHDLRHT